MEQRLSLVTLGVEDLSRATRFYEALGWHRVNAEPSISFFQLKSVVLGLWSRRALAEETGLADNGGFGGIALAYNVRAKAEVDSILEDAKRAGGTILRPAEERFWGGYSGYFADLDGHPWEVAWNPFWTIGDDGSVALPDTGPAQ